jgi:tetratricopeptide (TPR) repeat protein
VSIVGAVLDDGIHQQISTFCAEGNDLADENRHEAALEKFNAAWRLLPDPKSDWEAATWILAAIADSCFQLGKFKSSKEALEYAMHCPGAIGNPFLHLRLGQTLFEAGDPDASANELMRAYMAAGADIFESEDGKYLAFLKTRAIIE